MDSGEPIKCYYTWVQVLLFRFVMKIRKKLLVVMMCFMGSAAFADSALVVGMKAYAEKSVPTDKILHDGKAFKENAPFAGSPYWSSCEVKDFFNGSKSGSGYTVQPYASQKELRILGMNTMGRSAMLWLGFIDHESRTVSLALVDCSISSFSRISNEETVREQTNGYLKFHENLKVLTPEEIQLMRQQVSAVIPGSVSWDLRWHK